MRSRWRVVKLCVLASCVAACFPQPDLVYSNLRVYYGGLPRLDLQAIVEYDVLNSEYRKLKPDASDLPADVFFKPDSFYCISDANKADVYDGCQPYWDSIFEVKYVNPIWASSFAWELSHGVFEDVYGTSGEYRVDGGFYSIRGTQDFLAFVDRVTRGTIAALAVDGGQK